jgi:hypothetical protein
MISGVVKNAARRGMKTIESLITERHVFSPSQNVQEDSSDSIRLPENSVDN